MDIKLIALDIDDTLLNDKRQITPRTRQAVQDAVDAGVHVALASGRMLPSLMPIYQALGLKTPAICCNGAYVCAPGGEIIHKCPVPFAQASQVIAYARANDLYIQCYSGDQYYYERPGKEIELYQNLCGVTGTRVDDLLALGLDSDKLLIIHLPNMDDELPRVQAAFPQLEVARSKRFYAEINHPDATKGTALAALAAHYGLEAGQVMAIGDGTNDLPMLRYAGASVAMGNAPDVVKQQCRFVTLPCTQDGAAHAIYKWALGREK